MNPEEIAKLAFLVYPHITKTALDEPSVESLATKVRGLQKGLSPEDEFAAKVCTKVAICDLKAGAASQVCALCIY